MSIEAQQERLQKLLRGLEDCGVSNAVIMFEMKAGGEVKPHIARIGSPMACMALTEWAASYQHEEVYEGLEVSVWYDEDDDD